MTNLADLIGLGQYPFANQASAQQPAPDRLSMLAQQQASAFNAQQAGFNALQNIMPIRPIDPEGSVERTQWEIAEKNRRNERLWRARFERDPLADVVLS